MDQFATVIYVKSNDMNNRRVRKDFETERALEKWFAANDASGKFDIVETRIYN